VPPPLGGEMIYKVQGTVMPVNEVPKCNFLDCAAGLGLAGHGRCFLRGDWEDSDCPKFQTEEEFIGKREELPWSSPAGSRGTQ
jgi:hypothetical protein